MKIAAKKCKESIVECKLFECVLRLEIWRIWNLMTGVEGMMKFSIALFMIALSVMTACAGAQKEQVKEPTISEVKPAPQMENEDKQQVIQNVAALKKGIFAFANEKGQKLLADPETAVYAGEEPLIAIGQAGKLLKVRYSGKQKATQEDDGRQTVHNFNYQAGQLYEVTEGSAEPNETYIIIPESQFPAEALLTIQRVDPQHASAHKQELQEIKESKGREVEQAWPLIELPDGKSVYLVQFVRQGDDMLASLVVKAGIHGCITIIRRRTIPIPLGEWMMEEKCGRNYSIFYLQLSLHRVLC